MLVRAAENRAFTDLLSAFSPSGGPVHALAFPSQKQGKTTSYLNPGGQVVMVSAGFMACGNPGNAVNRIQANLGLQGAFSIS